MGGKSGGSTTTPNVDPGLTKEERELVLKEVELADFRLEQLEKQSEFQDVLRESLPSSIEGGEEFRRLEREERERQQNLQIKRGELEENRLLQAQELLPLQTRIAQLQLEEFERGGRPSPEQIALIDKLAAEQDVIGQGQLDISNQDIIDNLRSQANPDSRVAGDPVLSRLTSTRAEGSRQKEQLSRQLRAGASEAKLNFPLAQAGLEQTQAQQLASLGVLSGRFQSELQQQATNNRLQLLGQVGGQGLGLSTGVGARPGALGLGLQKNRIAAGGTTTKTKSPGQGAAIAGAGLGILGAVLAPFTAGASLALTAVGAGLSAAGR